MHAKLQNHATVKNHAGFVYTQLWIGLMLEKLALGTASFGCAHGLGPRSQKVSENEVAEILSLASVNGIHLIDVAQKMGTANAFWAATGLFRPHFAPQCVP